MTKYFGIPFANAGDKTAIPVAVQPGGEISYTEGWTADYEAEQGVDPNAKDIDRQKENQFKFDISEAMKEVQERGILPYRADVDYSVDGVVIASDSLQYIAIAANGPATSVVDPVGNPGTWGKTKTSRKNLIINGDFSINQRGDSPAGQTLNNYWLDRWYINASGGTYQISQEEFGAADGVAAKNFARLDITTGDGYCGIQQRIENWEVIQGNTVTLSFKYKLSGKELGFQQKLVDLAGGVIATQDFGTLPIAAVWTDFAITFLAVTDASAWGAEGRFTLSIFQKKNDNSATPYVLDLANVQLEIGPQATDFEYQQKADILAQCQRYYWAKSTGGAAYAGQVIKNSITDFERDVYIDFPATMRVAPTVVATTTNWTPAVSSRKDFVRFRGYVSVATDLARVEDVSADAEI